MRKIVAIGESVLDTLFSGGQPVKSFVGGRVTNAAASLAMAGVPCSMVSECTTDSVGDIIINFLTSHGVDVSSVDRYPDGCTRLSAIFTDVTPPQIVNYGAYPDERFDVVWPRINEDDIVLMGSLYAVDLPQRSRLFDLLKHAMERKATIVYLPGLQHGIQFRITHVMPHLLENFELSQLVIATRHDLDTIFPGETSEECYQRHIRYYDNTFVFIDDNRCETVYCGDRSFKMTNREVADGKVDLFGWQSGLTAGIIFQLLVRGVLHHQLGDLDAATWQSIMDEAHRWAMSAAGNEDHCIGQELAAQCGEAWRSCASANEQEQS
ncbi:MAG: hypothetical protein J5565_02215 [Muribaculaceae bacterium]|nr:hypothetical protein [Muribaculaceae bacterium]